jgi:hypothetical protein
MKAMTPWSMLGGRGGCIAAILDEAEGVALQRAFWTKKIRRAGRGFVHNPG